MDDARHVDVIEVGRIAFHIYPECGQIGQVAVLSCDVGRYEFPVGYPLQITLVCPCFVARCLPGFIREGAIPDKCHRGSRVVLLRVSRRDGPKLVFERLVGRRVQHFGNAEIARCKSGKASVAFAVIVVFRCIIRGFGAVEDTHANITDTRAAYFAFFEFERDGLGFGIDALDDPGAWSKPCITHCNIDPIVPQFRNLKESP